MADIAPWIQPAAPAQYLGSGYQMGVQSQSAAVEAALAAQRLATQQQQIALEHQAKQAALDEAQRRADMEAEIERDRISQRARVEQQQLEINRAIHEATIGIDRERLKETQQANTLKWVEEGRRAQALQGYQQAIAGGQPYEQAILQNLGMFKSAGGLAPLARQAQLPEQMREGWIPRDPKTGQGGYYLDPKGVPHWAPKQADPLEGEIKNWESIRQAAYDKLPLAQKKAKTATEDVIKKANEEIVKLRRRQQLGEDVPGQEEQPFQVIGGFKVRIKKQ